jgi:Autographiviridae endonuclease VII
MTKDERRIYQREHARRWRAEHPNYEVDRQRRWRLANPEKVAAQRERHLANRRALYLADPEKSRAVLRNQVFTRYGLTRESYNDLLESQDGLCDICAEPMELPCIDHDHVTGEVRGLLCVSCNAAIGQFHDSVEVLESAIAYLRRDRSQDQTA